MSARIFFQPSELQAIQVNLRHAEDCLEAFYRFSPREWFPYSYHLLTGRDFPEGPPVRHPKVLAEVIQHVPAATQRSGPAAGHPSYSIVLFDANIIRLLDASPALAFERLLLYVLTHELVHIARFFNLIEYDLPDGEKHREEWKVHQLTARILARMEDEELTRLSQAYLSDGYSF